MLFTISRASDEFRADPRPSQDWQPHSKSEWDDGCKNWFIDVRSPEALVDLGNSSPLVIRTTDHNIPHIMVDDV